VKSKQNGHHYHAEPGNPWQGTSGVQPHEKQQVRLRCQDQVEEIGLKIQEEEFILSLRSDQEEAEQVLILTAVFASPMILQVLLGDRTQFFYYFQEGKFIYLYFEHHSHLFEILQPFEMGHLAERHTPQAQLAPMAGVVREIKVKVGEKVKVGQPLMVLEAMHSTHVIKASHAGVVKNIAYQVGDTVEMEAEVMMLAFL